MNSPPANHKNSLSQFYKTNSKQSSATMPCIAVIGSGVSGLSAAKALAGHAKIVVFEGSSRLGGHIHAVPVIEDGKQFFLDTGFMVFNPINYPNLCQFFNEENIPSMPTSMSLSIKETTSKNDTSGFEFTGSPFHKLLFQWKNFLRPDFTRFLTEIVRFNNWARSALQQINYSNTMPLLNFSNNTLNDMNLHDILKQPQGWMLSCELGQLRAKNIFSEKLFNHYLAPIAGAIWSSNTKNVYRFPLLALVKFLYNHGMLGITTQHHWRVLKNGSNKYLQAISKPFASSVHLSMQVKSVLPLPRSGKNSGKIRVRTKDKEYFFDKVIIATHANEALNMLEKPTKLQQELLSSFRYETSDVILHTDACYMPKKRSLWSSWNVLCHKNSTTTQPAKIAEQSSYKMSFHYYINLLQRIKAKNSYFVTLNPPWPVEEKKIIWQGKYSHPLLTLMSEQYKERLPQLNTEDNIFFSGSYFGSGFHEDGFSAGLNAAAAVKKTLPKVKKQLPSLHIHNSALTIYKGWVMHHRLLPKAHRFRYPLFMFYLDLDRTDNVPALFWGHNRPGIFRFNDKDFLPNNENKAKTIKQPNPNIKNNHLPHKKSMAASHVCLKQKALQHIHTLQPKLARRIDKIYLLAHHRMWGYLFNPASFYFCFDKYKNPITALTEVTNTFGERKLYLVPLSSAAATHNNAAKKKVAKKPCIVFNACHPKQFYISPFSRINTQLQFNFRMPGKQIHLHVNEAYESKKTIQQKGNTKHQLKKPYLYALFHGKSKTIKNSWQLIAIALAYPFITFKVIIAIHLQAFFLWLKRLPYFSKQT